MTKQGEMEKLYDRFKALTAQAGFKRKEVVLCWVLS
jgi:hypothetical protein